MFDQSSDGTAPSGLVAGVTSLSWPLQAKPRRSASYIPTKVATEDVLAGFHFKFSRDWIRFGVLPTCRESGMRPPTLENPARG